MDHPISRPDNALKVFWCTRYAPGPIVLGVIAGYLLVSEHRAHFFLALPFLPLLAWPVMHVFMTTDRRPSAADGHEPRRAWVPAVATGVHRKQAL